jgi:hypothetical protein
METFLAALDWYYSGHYKYTPFSSLVLTMLNARLDEIRKMASIMSLVLDTET